ncbi:FkbM family methyltransferase [Roseivirga sp.]|uniref:FkbM family methyltransferase n=1 Tax=Roseivirga sp. TaxID=1964215 RepID=UPI003B8BD9AF
MIDSKPLVFIGVPAYNRPSGLRNTLTALTAQSYQYIEIHVSDDLSPNPAVVAEVEEFTKRDSRVKAHYQKQNIGIIRNHQFLLTEIPDEAAYVMWACDDDNWHPDYIKVCVEALEKNPEAILCTTDNLWVHKGALCQINHNEQVHTLGISDPVTRYKQILPIILWWNHSFYGPIRRNAYKKLSLQNTFAFDILFIAHLSLLGQFIKIQKPYFVKTIGGYGSELKQNLNSVKDESKISRYFPRLSVFLNFRKSIKNTALLNSSQKHQLLISSFKSIARKSTYSRSVINSVLWVFRKGVNAIKFAFTWFKIRHFRSAWSIHIHRLPVQEFTFSKKEGKLYSKKLGSVFVPSSDLFNNYYEFIELKEKNKALFKYDPVLRLNQVTINNTSFELKEMFYGFLLYEIFVQETYQYDFKSPSIVVDIGSNVGIAALYFAQKTNVEKVFSFEPFQETFAAAQNNLDLNPELRSKVFMENFALSDEEKTLTVDYSFQTSQLSSIKEIDKDRPDSHDLQLTTIQVKKTSEVLMPILKENSDKTKVLKIDTEGSEYEIVEDLAKSGLLKVFDSIMIEWHGQGYEVLLKTLKKNNFEVRVTDQDYSTKFGYTGMIYAHNKPLKDQPLISL